MGKGKGRMKLICPSMVDRCFDRCLIGVLIGVLIHA